MRRAGGLVLLAATFSACAELAGLDLDGFHSRDDATADASAGTSGAGGLVDGAWGGSGGSGGAGQDVVGDSPGVTRVCASATESTAAVVHCPGGTWVTAIVFASYGNPAGSCGSLSTGSCHATASDSLARCECLGKTDCTVTASNASLGDPCSGQVKTLAIEVECSTAALAPGSLVDTQSDAQHCGRCGHDCAGGTCDSSLCQPVLLAPTGQIPWGIAIDQTHVFWAISDGIISKVPKLGGSATTLANGEKNARRIAVDADGVYWTITTNGATVRKAPKGGGSAQTLASGQDVPEQLALWGTTLFWLNWGTVANNYTDGSIRRVATSGGTSTAVVTSEDVSDLAADSTHVYYTNYNKGQVRRISHQGGAVETLVTGPAGPATIALGSSTVVWANASTQEIWKVSKTGGASMLLASAQKSVNAIVADETWVYWAKGGSIYRVSMGGGTPETIASAGGTVEGLAADDECLYFTSWTSASAVKKVAKP